MIGALVSSCHEWNGENDTGTSSVASDTMYGTQLRGRGEERGR